MKIDQIYVINLRSTNEDIVERLDSLGIPYPVDYTILDAINGKDLLDGKINLSVPYQIADWWKIPNHPNSWWSRDVNAAELGCTMSHLKAWSDAIQNGYENIIVLEEDFSSQGNGWPTEEIANLPADYDLFFLGRKRVPTFDDIPFNDLLVKPNYSYNSHAYMISANAIRKALSLKPQMNIIPADELLPGLMNVHPRSEINDLFGSANFNAFAANKEHDLYYVTQRAIMKSSDFAEFPILDTEDWAAWVEKYISPVMLQRDFELMTDEIGDNIVEFPLFTDQFCEELIQLAESRGKWTVGRHEHYPTNDMLIETLGLGDAYRRVIRTFVAPLATWYWTLEGKGWDLVEDETFIIRYKPDLQGQLSVHHDYSSYTIGVKLNDEFEGGGTFFPKYQVNAMPKRNGNAFLHPGMITHRHGGRPVYSGTRYIAVSFIRNTEILK